MNNNIIRICLAAALPAMLWSCSEKIDNSAFSDVLGKDYNQEILWDVDSLAFRRASWSTTDASYGAEIRQAQIKMLGGTQSVSYITYPSNMFITRIAAADHGLQSTSELAAGSKAVFAINGGPCDASGATSFVMIGNKVISEGSGSASGAGALAINETLDGSTIGIVQNASSSSLQTDYTSALIAGPVLVAGGKEQTFADTEENNTRQARSIIGTDDKGNYFMAVIDGGVTGQADGATMAEAAFIARIIGMQDAVCLSGGNASTLWSGTDGVVSHPSGHGSYDKPGEEGVANIVYVELNTPFAGGDGTKNDPYQIGTSRHIQNMSTVLEEGTAVYFELIDDIDMEGIDWIPLNYADPYMKIVHLDGNGHTIYNFSSSYSSYPSFFGVLHGECRNIRFLNARIDAGSTSSGNGIIGGYIGTGGKPGLLENAYFQGSLYLQNQAANGGIAGQIRDGIVRNCYADIEIVTPDTWYADVNFGIGIIAGDMRDNCTIENCFATGKVLGKFAFNAGGLAGRSNGSNIVIQNNISWVSEVNGRAAAGSVIGRWQTSHGTNQNNYSNKETVITTYANGGTGVTQDIYHKNDNDYADLGKYTDNPCQTATSLGWDTDIWDLTGETPQLKLFIDSDGE